MSSDTLDREALRAKYREERQKRIRPEGNDQYVEPTGRFASLLEDPYVPRVERAPVHDDVTVAIIGGGFGGLCTGAQLKIAGVFFIQTADAGSYTLSLHYALPI